LSTQAYYAQPGAPPPAARPAKFSPIQGLAEIIAISQIPGENAPSQIGGPEVKFRLVDGRAWYVPPAVADDIYRQRIQPRQQIEVLKFGRMKHEVRIVGLQANLGNGSAPSPPHQPADVQQDTTAYRSPNNTPPPVAWPADEHQQLASAPAPPLTISGRLWGAYMVAVDTLLETKAYAQRKGLALEVKCEDVRCLAATILIEQSKRGAQ
jgi:hypothetical protein